MPAGASGFACLKFIPQRAHLCGLILGQQAKQAGCGGGLCLRHGIGIMVQMDWVVARVNLYQIVQQDHLDRLESVGVIAQLRDVHHQRIEGNVPAVFGGIFRPGQILQRRLTVHLFQFAGLIQEGHLGIKAGSVGHDLWIHFGM